MPAALATSAFAYGVAYGVLKIAWIVLAAVFLYDISVETGQFEIMKESIAGITPDTVGKLLRSTVVEDTRHYFDEFYKTINDPREAKASIIDACNDAVIETFLKDLRTAAGIAGRGGDAARAQLTY